MVAHTRIRVITELQGGLVRTVTPSSESTDMGRVGANNDHLARFSAICLIDHSKIFVQRPTVTGTVRQPIPAVFTANKYLPSATVLKSKSVVILRM